MKAKLTPSSRKLVEIKGGNVSVRIYTGNKCIGELVATKLANGENEVLRITSHRQGRLCASDGPFAPLGRAVECRGARIRFRRQESSRRHYAQRSG